MFPGGPTPQAALQLVLWVLWSEKLGKADTAINLNGVIRGSEVSHDPDPRQYRSEHMLGSSGVGLRAPGWLPGDLVLVPFWFVDLGQATFPHRASISPGVSQN